MLAADWQNPLNPLDINDDRLIEPLDALLVINRLNFDGAGPLPVPPGDPVPPPFLDVTGDDFLAPIDALLVINALNKATPIIVAELSNDTAPGGATNSDSLTSDAAVIGGISIFGSLVSLKAGLDTVDVGSFVDITSDVTQSSLFLDDARIIQINGGPLDEGLHTLRLQATNSAGRVSDITEVSFTLDTAAPSPSFAVDSPVRITFSSFQVGFDEPISDTALDPAAYELSFVGGGSGPIPAVDTVQRIDNQNVQVQLSSLIVDGDIRLRVKTDVSDLAGNHPLNPTDFDFTVADPTGVLRISPGDGEAMVSTTRKTIIRFDEPIDPVTVTDDSFFLTANSQQIPGRIVVSSTEKFATIFYDDPLPASTEVRVTVMGDMIFGRDGLAIDANGNDEPGGFVATEFRTLPLTRIPGTDVSGFIFDSFNFNPDGSNRPIVGATIRVDAFPAANAVTDENGFFILEDMPAPEFFVHVDGSTATNAPAGFVYPNVGKPFHSVPGQEVPLAMGGQPFDIFLPPMSLADVQPLSDTEATDVGFGAAGKSQLVEMFPGIDPAMWDKAQVTIAPDGAVDDQGNPATQAVIIPVPPDRIPGALPSFLTPELVLSIQAIGATNFDVPAPVIFPNLEILPSGEKALQSGDKALIYSFDHDAGRWVIVGPGTVSEDGTSIVSDPGVGIVAPGWHIAQRGTQPVQPPPIPVPEAPSDVPEGPGNVCKGLDHNDGWALINALFIALKEVTSAGPVIKAGIEVVNGVISLRQQIETLSLGFGDGVLTQQEVAAGLQTLTVTKNTLRSAYGEFTALNPVDKAIDVAKAAFSIAKIATDRIGARGEDCLGHTGALITTVASRIFDFSVGFLSKAEMLSASLRDVPFTALDLAFDGLVDLVNTFTPPPAGFAAEGEGPTREDILAAFTSTLAEADNFIDVHQAPVEGLDADLTETNDELVGLRDDALVPLIFGLRGFRGSFWRMSLDGLELRGNTNFSGEFEDFTITPGNAYQFEFYDFALNALAVTEGISASSGQQTVLGPFEVQNLDGAVDTDGDQIPDVAEQVIGTSINNPDTDGDGINDFAELEQGLDPLNGLVFPTGVISSLPLFGRAQSIAIEGSIAYVATGSHGLALIDVSEFDNPIILGQLELPGTSTDVGVDLSLGLAVVAGNAEGIHIVDISDPMAPRLLQTITSGAIGAEDVDVANGVAYVAVGGVLSSVDLVTKQLVKSITLPSGIITDITREGSFIYTMDSERNLRAIETSGFLMTLRDSLQLPQGGGRLFVGNGIAYVGAIDSNFRGGFATADVSDPDNIQLIAESAVFSPDVAPGEVIVANGSGLGLLIGTTDSSLRHQVLVMDLSDPQLTNEQLLLFDLLSSPVDVSIAWGLGFVATRNEDFNVINYVSFDANEQPPTVAISSPAVDADPGSPGVQIIEGSAIPIVVNSTDDIQVRKVDLLANGLMASDDVSFPFEFSTRAPLLSSGETTLDLQARAIDTGGNIGLSNTLSFEIVPDIVPPALLDQFPTNGAGLFQGIRNVWLQYSEPLDAATVTTDTFQLKKGGVILTPQNFALRNDDSLVQLVFNPLGAGNFELVVKADMVTDLAGNPLGAGDVVTTFELTRPPSLFPLQEFDTFKSLAIAWGDLDGDGDNDLATANSTATVSILLNNGDGTFGDDALFSVGNSTQRGIALGLLNNDAHLDLVTTDSSSNSVSILLGNGNGTFGERTTFTVGRAPVNVTLGDFNEDGKLDLVTANILSNVNTVTVLLGDGAGGFGDRTDLSVGTGPEAVSVGDLNGDGHLDIVAANGDSVSVGGGNSVSVLLGDGDGGFAAKVNFATGLRPIDVAIGDLNDDGIPDLVTANRGSGANSITMLFGQDDGTGKGNGAFGGRMDVVLGSFVAAVDLDDINGDGRPDIVAASFGDARISVLLSRPGGDFETPRSFLTAPSPRDVRIVALNNDSELDLVTVSGDRGITTMLGSGGGDFLSLKRVVMTTNPEKAASADFNGDGRLDLVTANGFSDNVTIFLNNPDGTFDQTDFPAGSVPNTPFVGDLNGDTFLDLVTTNGRFSGNTANVLLGDGAGGFGVPTEFTVGNRPESGVLADLNHDGRLDLATADVGDKTVSILLGVGDGTFAARTTFSTVGTPFSMISGDMNNDGNVDLITIEFSRLQIHLGVGDGSFSPGAAVGSLSSALGGTVGDFNNDGKLDVAVGSGAQISVYLGNGAGGLGSAINILTPSTKPQFLTTADIDGDSIDDILSTNGLGANTVTLVLSNGDGSFTTPQFFAVGKSPSSVGVGDLNRDGALDIFTTSSSTARGVYILNGTAGNFGFLLTAASGPAPLSNLASDVLLVDQSQLSPLVQQALSLWAASDGANESLANVQVLIADLPGAQLARASQNTIWVDYNAAGYGWFIDTTPADHAEFLRQENGSYRALDDALAAGRFDLLTTLLHEIGHLLGEDHDQDGGVMSAELELGIRKLPYQHNVDNLMADEDFWR